MLNEEDVEDNIIQFTLEIKKDFSRNLDIQIDLTDPDLAKFLTYLFICMDEGVLTEDILNILTETFGEDIEPVVSQCVNYIEAAELSKEGGLDPMVGAMEVIQ